MSFPEKTYGSHRPAPASRVIDRRGPAIGENHRSMTKRGLNLLKYRVGSIRRSVGRSVGSIAKIRGRRSSSRAHRWFRRSVRWSRSFGRVVRSRVSVRTDERRRTERRRAGRKRDAHRGDDVTRASDRRRVGASDRASSFGTRRRRRRFAFGLDLFIHLDWIIHSGVSAFVRSSSSSSSRPSTRRGIDRLRRASRVAFVVFGRGRSGITAAESDARVDLFLNAARPPEDE